MPTRGLIDRQRIGKDILHAARTHARQVGERLNDTLQLPVGEGETPVDFVNLQLQLASFLETRLQALEAADRAHLQELDDDREPRLRRDEATSALYGKLVEVRELLRGLYGFDRANALVGVDGPTALDPLTLHGQAVAAVERLREPGPELPRQRLGSVEVDRNGLAAEVQPFVDELGGILEDLKREKRQREATKNHRDTALGDFDVAAGAVARILIGYDQLAGFPDFAEKVRLTLPRRNGSRPGEDEELPEGPPPSEDSPEETTEGAPDAESPEVSGTEPVREPAGEVAAANLNAPSSGRDESSA